MEIQTQIWEFVLPAMMTWLLVYSVSSLSLSTNTFTLEAANLIWKFILDLKLLTTEDDLLRKTIWKQLGLLASSPEESTLFTR